MELSTLESGAERSAFDEAHRRLCLVGYGNVPQAEQDGIVEHLLDELLMVQDTESLIESANVDVTALATEDITSGLVVVLLHSGLSIKQICAIYDTGASKPFVKTVRECIRSVLVAPPASAKVTTATSDASAASISLRRYNFAITDEMVNIASRIGIDISKYDAITVLAAPLVCADF